MAGNSQGGTPLPVFIAGCNTDSDRGVQGGSPIPVYITGIDDSVDSDDVYVGPNDEMKLSYDAGEGRIDTDEVTPSDLVVNCGAEKTLVLEEPVYDDLPPTPITAARLGSTAPTLTTFVGNIQQYTFDATNDFVIGATEVTHSYEEGTNIEIHVHWATNGTEGVDKAVKWQLEYTISNAKEAAPFSNNFAAAVTVSKEIVIPANTPDRAHIITELDTFDGSSVTIGAYICWRFNRIAAAGTAPAADPFGLAVGFHVQQDTMGSRQEYIK